MLKYERFTKSKQENKAWFQMSKGDVFDSAGKTFAFDRVPKGAKNIYALCLNDNKSYRVTMRDDFTIIGKYEFPKQEVDTSSDRENLQPGELFVITGGGSKDAKLFRYESKNPKTVVGINVLSGNRVRIDNNFRFIKIENLKF